MESPSPAPPPAPPPPPPPPRPNPEPNQQSEAQIPSEEPNPSCEDEEKQGGEGEVVVEEEEEEEEEAECGFCLFMKEGGCKDPFIAWEECVKGAENSGEDVVEKCAKATVLLKKCMDAHADYYEPLLRAEKAMADAVANDADSERREEEKLPEPEIEIEKCEVKPPS
ncbi:hypothetical protein ACMD2_17764 [Ananas comosus]|uniref:GCK domain-containing protein n=1 Tax=Ananas comosus TaxID=4615 RepID=A0A199UFU1_ANACO|nr:hypothetical protein ACMD2_17764 [Ananas comosus]